MYQLMRAALYSLLFYQASALALSQAPPPDILPVIPFAWKSVALPEAERAQLGNALNEVRQRYNCEIEAVIVTGYANSREGNKKEILLLSEQRANYVRTLMQSYDVPDKVIFSEGRGSSLTSNSSNVSNPRVELQFIGFRTAGSYDGCPPLDGNTGFRRRLGM